MHNKDRNNDFYPRFLDECPSINHIAASHVAYQVPRFLEHEHIINLYINDNKLTFLPLGLQILTGKV